MQPEEVIPEEVMEKIYKLTNISFRLSETVLEEIRKQKELERQLELEKERLEKEKLEKEKLEKEKLAKEKNAKKKTAKAKLEDKEEEA